jgi:hypothetical protein
MAQSLAGEHFIQQTREPNFGLGKTLFDERETPVAERVRVVRFSSWL